MADIGLMVLPTADTRDWIIAARDPLLATLWLGGSGMPPTIAPEPDPDDVVPPVVTFIEPADGRLTPTTTVVVDVTDDTGNLLTVFMWATYAGDTEVIFTGDGFAPRFAASTITAITNGFRFELRRTGGWTQAPFIAVKAFDPGGNEAT